MAHRVKLLGCRTSLLFLVLVSITIVPVTAEAPVANFTGLPVSGHAPLAVSFTDLSANNPSGWAWFFGDENFTAPWNQMTVNGGWSGRMGQSSVVMPDGSIILIGGYSGGYSNRMGMSTANAAPWLQLVAIPGSSSGYAQINRVAANNYVVMVGGYSGGTIYNNDVWLSTDDGATWALETVNPGWMARAGQSAVLMPDGSLVLMGGYTSGGTYNNDVWLSTDGGATWTLETVSPGWSPRAGQSSVVMPDGSIVLIGGWGGQADNDVWKSTDDGATWALETVNPGWSARAGQSSVVMPDGSIVLMGGWGQSGRYGQYNNDVWLSTDGGATWALETVNPGWSARAGQSSVVMPDGSIVLMGGYSGSSIYNNDVWRSTDNGATWTQVTVNPGWSARAGQSSVVMPDGSIVLMGGYTSGNENGDVWRLIPAGSSRQNPSHTYVKAGIYPVTLEVNNVYGSNTTNQAYYINVSAPLPKGSVQSVIDTVQGNGTATSVPTQLPTLPAASIPQATTGITTGSSTARALLPVAVPVLAFLITVFALASATRK